MSIVGMRKYMQGKLQHIMLALAVVFAIGWVGIAIGSGRMGGGGEESQSLSGTVAKVNGDKIERQAFETDYLRRVEQMNESGQWLSAMQKAQIRGQVFDENVEKMLQMQAAEKEGIKVSRRDINKKIDQVINDELKRLKEQFFAGQKGPKTDKDFDAELKKNGMSLAKVKAEMKKSIDRDAASQLLISERLDEKIKSRVDAGEKAVRESYEEVRLRQITISPKPTEELAKKKAGDIVTKLRSGADFAQLARENSDDPYKENGGSRTYFLRRSYMEPELAAVAFKLKDGEISDPVKTPQGYVIVKVEERQSALPADFDDPKKKKEYKESYLAAEQSRIRQQYFTKLRETAKVVVYDPELKAYHMMRAASPGPMTPEQQKTRMKDAIKQYEKALDQSAVSSDARARIYAQIAYMYDFLRRPGMLQTTQEERLKYRDETKKAVDGALKYSESNDLRMMMADILVDEGAYDAAVEHLTIASENSTAEDIRGHQVILSMYERMKGYEGAAELIAKEKAWISEYEEKMAKEDKSGMTTQPFKVDQ